MTPQDPPENIIESVPGTRIGPGPKGPLDVQFGHPGDFNNFEHEDQPALRASSADREAVWAEANAHDHSAVAAIQLDPHAGAAAIYAEHRGFSPGETSPRLAGFFKGDIIITGDITLEASDCAEDFDVEDSAAVEPGMVMVLEDSSRLGVSKTAYDKRVAGVVSGAGSYRPGLILGRQQDRRVRCPLALAGKVFCRVDASYSPVEVGDLLTTSPTPGHAMRADDPLRAFGAVIGKALSSLTSGRELIPVLATLQ